jgi:hypothetical protein
MTHYGFSSVPCRACRACPRSRPKMSSGNLKRLPGTKAVPWHQGRPSITAPPWVGSRSPDGWDQIPRWAGGWACTSHPGVLGSIPKREEPGKTGAPCIKIPGSSRVPVRDGQPSPHRPRLVVSRSTCPPISPPPPCKHLCTRSCSNKHTHSITVIRPQKALQLETLLGGSGGYPQPPEANTHLGLQVSYNGNPWVRHAHGRKA